MTDIVLPSKWNEDGYAQFQEMLKNLSDESYKDFNSHLIPDTPLAYGIRIPIVRKIAREILKGDYESYLKLQKTSYHEEVIIEGLVLAGIKCGYPETLANMEQFVPKIYNWAINDTVVFKEIKKHTELFINDVDRFIFSDNPWAQRFGYSHLMSFFLTDEYIDAVLEKVDAIDSDFYYVQMMQAWLLATAAAKQREKTLRYLEHNRLNRTTMKMTVKKMRESYRISKEDKEFAASLI